MSDGFKRRILGSDMAYHLPVCGWLLTMNDAVNAVSSAEPQ